MLKKSCFKIGGLWVSRSSSIIRPEYNKKTSLPWARENSLAVAFGLHLKHQLFLALQQMAFRLELKHQCSWVSSLPAHPAQFGLANLCNQVNQFLTTHLYVYIHPIDSVSLEKNLTNTKCLPICVSSLTMNSLWADTLFYWFLNSQDPTCA